MVGIDFALGRSKMVGMNKLPLRFVEVGGDPIVRRMYVSGGEF